MESVGYKMGKLKLKTLLEQAEAEQPIELTKEQKASFMEQVRNFSAMGESVYGKGDMQEIIESVRNIVEMARTITLSEGEDWFDNVTVGRHMKSLGESYKVFSKTMMEMKQLQERASAAYDEIGQNLNKYFDVG